MPTQLPSLPASSGVADDDLFLVRDTGTTEDQKLTGTLLKTYSQLETVDAAAGAVGVTLGTSDESVQAFNPAGAITVKFNNTFALGRSMTIINQGTGVISVTANDNSSVGSVAPGSAGTFKCIVAAPADNTDWAQVTKPITASATAQGLVTSFAPTVKSRVLTTTGAGYAITAVDGYTMLNFACNGADRTLTVPAASADYTGKKITIRKIDAQSQGTLLISGTINGSSDTAFNRLVGIYGQCQIECDGSAWYYSKEISDTYSQASVTFTGNASVGGASSSFTGTAARQGKRVTLNIPQILNCVPNTGSNTYLGMTALTHWRPSGDRSTTATLRDGSLGSSITNPSYGFQGPVVLNSSGVLAVYRSGRIYVAAGDVFTNGGNCGITGLTFSYNIN